MKLNIKIPTSVLKEIEFFTKSFWWRHEERYGYITPDKYMSIKNTYIKLSNMITERMINMRNVLTDIVMSEIVC